MVTGLLSSDAVCGAGVLQRAAPAVVQSSEIPVPPTPPHFSLLCHCSCSFLGSVLLDDLYELLKMYYRTPVGFLIRFANIISMDSVILYLHYRFMPKGANKNYYV